MVSSRQKDRRTHITQKGQQIQQIEECRYLVRNMSKSEVDNQQNKPRKERI